MEASRLTTFFEIRRSRWEITEMGGQAKDCLSRPAASRTALLHLLCQNCPSLHPRGRLTQDKSTLYSMTFYHYVFPSKPWSKNMAGHKQVSFMSSKSRLSKRSIAGNAFIWERPFSSRSVIMPYPRVME